MSTGKKIGIAAFALGLTLLAVANQEKISTVYDNVKHSLTLEDIHDVATEDGKEVFGNIVKFDNENPENAMNFYDGFNYIELLDKNGKTVEVATLLTNGGINNADGEVKAGKPDINDTDFSATVECDGITYGLADEPSKEIEYRQID